MNAFITQIIRTASSYFLGILFTWLLSLGFDFPQEIKDQLYLALPVFIGSLYYIGIAALEKKVPWIGWLIGVAKTPVYSKPNDLVVSISEAGKETVLKSPEDPSILSAKVIRNIYSRELND